MIGNIKDFIKYALDRGVIILEDEAPVFLTKATDFLANKCWEGDQVDDEQPWPRRNLIFNGSTLLDGDGNPINAKDGETIEQPATPKKVVTATYRLAMEVANGVDLMPTVTGSQTLSERVEGAVTVTYAESSIGTPLQLPWLDSLISDWSYCEQNGGLNFAVRRG